MHPKIFLFEELPSTSDWAREQLDSFSDDFVVVAQRQTLGHGRKGRSWHSEQGGLYFTSVFRTPLPPSQHPHYAQVAAISLAEWVEQLGLAPEIKWPNDLLVDGAKIAGILLDAVGHGEQRRLLLGIGLNLNNHPQVADRPTTALGTVLDRTLPPDEVLRELLPVLRKNFDRFEVEGMAPFATRLRKFDRLVGTRRTLLLGERTVEGEVVGVNDAGALLFLSDTGEQLTVWSGELTI